MKPKRKFNMPVRVILALCTIACFVMIILSFKYQDRMNPAKTYIGNIIQPMQRGINSLGHKIYDFVDLFRTKQDILDENKELKERLESVKSENISLIEDRNELASLRELYKLDQGYKQYPKVAARVVSHDDTNWYNEFTIDKGSDDGIQKNMNVIAGNGLVGIVSELGKSYSKVRSIIDDNSYVSGMFVRTSDLCDVKGNLATLKNGYIDVERISIDAEIEEGYEVVTSYQSDRYLEGILIGYVSDIKPDPNNMTMTAKLVPVVDFSRLDTVLVITQVSNYDELEDMTNYD
ncbi:MAG: rod shape-determining protein MreC [Lachnospiraceae bacterium]|nr:rod shape-determining protein MreC [Lachnospiraceae bacterium]